MNNKRIVSALAVAAFALAGCGGGGVSTPTTTGSGAGPGGSQSTYNGPLYPTSFTISLPKTTSSRLRAPQYVGAGAESVKILLSTVNGSGAPSGLANNPAIDNITPANCPCTVSGPSVPPGGDGFTIVTYDQTGASGNMLGTSTFTQTITAGQPNTISATLLGVPQFVVWGAAPSGTGGTAFSNTALSLTIEDADHNAITGSYFGAISLLDSDLTGATSLSTTFITSSTVAAGLTLSYTGLDIVPATLSATSGVPGFAQSNLTFSPTVQQFTTDTSEIDLYATSGTGSSGTATATQVGWTNSPYTQAVTASLGTTVSGNNCASFSTSVSGATVTVSATGSPTAGECAMTVTGGGAPASAAAASVLLTYTTTGVGVNANHRR